MDCWAYENNVTLDYSRPGKPTDNPFIESFNGSFRDECLSLKDFNYKMEYTMNVIMLKDGRRLSYLEYGSKVGIPVLFFHGFPGSHLDVQVFNGPELASRLNIRLIAVNRPGYQESDPQSGRELLDWPDDVSQLADNLDLNKFSILAYSGGGPFGLACAYEIPDRIDKVAIVSGMGPATAPESKKGAAMTIPKAPKLILKGMIKMIQNKPDKFRDNMRKGFPEVDQEIFDIPKVENALMKTMNTAIKSGPIGALHDARIYKRNWKFDLEKINQRIYLWHGEDDRNVKIETGTYVSERLPDCVSSIKGGEGHLSLIYKHAGQILKLFVSKS